MSDHQELKGHRDLKVYQLAYKLAIEIFVESKAFPKDGYFIDRSDTALLTQCCDQHC